MRFEVELFVPGGRRGDTKTSELGICRFLSHPIFVSVLSSTGIARAIPLSDVRELDATTMRYATTRGETAYATEFAFPDRLYVQAPTGHVMVLRGETIARLARARRQGAPTGRVGW